MLQWIHTLSLFIVDMLTYLDTCRYLPPLLPPLHSYSTYVILTPPNAHQPSFLTQTPQKQQRQPPSSQQPTLISHPPTK